MHFPLQVTKRAATIVVAIVIAAIVDVIIVSVAVVVGRKYLLDEATAMSMRMDILALHTQLVSSE